MKSVLPLYKKRGQTPLQCIKHFKQLHPEYQQETLSYAGRLDPMAEGLLLVLVGKENKKRERYENLVKTYEFEVLFGLTTDTYDTLGKITSVTTPPSEDLLQQKLRELVPTLQTSLIQPYPPYSSMTVRGKPLFYWARNELLSTIEIPTKEVTITNISFHTLHTLTKQELTNNVIHDITTVTGNFRQDEIINDWKRIETSSLETLPVAMFTATVSSGTYIRSLANRMGELVGCGALAYTIKRTKIGDFTLEKEYH